MNRHHGRVLKEIVRMKNIEDDRLASLLNSNKRTIDRLFHSVNIKWDMLATIGRLIGQDLSDHYPDLAQSARKSYTEHHPSTNEYSDCHSKVFLVDDSEMDTFIFKTSLKMANREVRLSTFNNGEEAINKLLEISINCPEKLPEHLFLDLKMPVMNGSVFLEYFYRLNIDPYSKVKIHVLTSSIFHSELNRFIAHPLVETCITKPIKANVIATII